MMKGQLAGLMKQAQAMQDNLKKAQEELANIEVEGQSGAGLVKVVMTCKNEVRRVTIDPSLLADDKDMLEDLVAAAFNDAVRRAEATSAAGAVVNFTATATDAVGPRRPVAGSTGIVTIVSLSWFATMRKRPSGVSVKFLGVRPSVLRCPSDVSRPVAGSQRTGLTSRRTTFSPRCWLSEPCDLEASRSSNPRKRQVGTSSRARSTRRRAGTHSRAPARSPRTSPRRTAGCRAPPAGWRTRTAGRRRAR